MKNLAFAISLLALLVSCKDDPKINNLTRPGGYAMGSAVELKFEVSGIKKIPDSLKVKVFEKKTAFVYEAFAYKINLKDHNEFSYLWDGRKPDGSWPSGGVYRVYALMGENNSIVSDTVEIGLTD